MSGPSPRAGRVAPSPVADLLGPEGPFARTMPGYEARQGQLEMASAVEDALATGGILFAEAGTGTGKTLAYLVPALEGGKKVIVSTATRALQEQIVKADVPLIARALGVEPRVALMKGLGNYVCRRRLAELTNSEEALAPALAETLHEVCRWVAETDTGDIAELAALPEDDPIWGRITASSELRVGQRCPHHEECFITRMKREAERARLVVVNHHLFFADLALRGQHPARVIPDYDAVIFDEAHQLEEIATSFFGLRVSQGRLDSLAGDAERALSAAARADPGLLATGGTRLLTELKRSSEAFFAAIRTSLRAEEVRVVVERDAWIGELEAAWHRVDSALDAISALAETTAGRALGRQDRLARAGGISDRLDAVTRRANELRDQLSDIICGGRGYVGWAELDPRRSSVGASPVDLSPLLRARIFESVPAVVLTSATLTSARPGAKQGASFEYVRGRLGVADDELAIRELTVPSPFDYAESALLYTPRDLPPPAAPEFLATMSERVRDLVEISDGGAFVLTTSNRSLRILERTLQHTLGGRTVLAQGQAPKHALISAFRAAGDAVLIATMSFWEGVDVPGRALRLVVLEKIPFAVPSEPIVRARAAAIEQEGKNAFMELHLPAAAILLKQGFGRLIRTRSDRGVVAILDTRILERRYGEKLISSLPLARRTTRLEEVRAFWTAVDR